MLASLGGHLLGLSRRQHPNASKDRPPPRGGGQCPCPASSPADQLNRTSCPQTCKFESSPAASEGRLGPLRNAGRQTVPLCMRTGCSERGGAGTAQEASRERRPVPGPGGCCQVERRSRVREERQGSACQRTEAMLLWGRSGGGAGGAVGRDGNQTPTLGSVSTWPLPSDPHHPPHSQPRRFQRAPTLPNLVGTPPVPPSFFWFVSQK